VLRLVGFFVLAVLLASFLGKLPVIGPLFARTGCLGIWISAMLLSWAFTRYGERAFRVRRDRGQIRQLAAVKSPRTEGKLGALYLAQGRRAKALPHLREAAAGEPEVAEWHYRLGSAELLSRNHDAAIESLQRCVELEPEYAYGAAQLRLAEACADDGRPEEALEAIAVFERNHGPSPESAFRRGLAYKALGDKDAARAAFGEVSRLASEAARYQRKSAGLWTVRARLASWL
jgi:tetratricopeptide (TPR) repeat protein